MIATVPQSPPVARSPGATCPKCGVIKKSKQRSCCGVGGAWFNNCGSVLNSKFVHTWTEGIRACKDDAGFLSGEAQSQTVVHRNITIQLHQNGTRGLNGHEKNFCNCDSSKGETSNVTCGKLSKMLSLILVCLLIIIL